MALIDNLEPGRNTDSASLAALLTSRTWTARELGKNQNIKVPNDTIWTATGNNPALSRELADRSIWIHLDPGHHDPSSRTNFQHPHIEQWAAQSQGRICGALSCLVDHWIKSGAKWGSTLGGFEIEVQIGKTFFEFRSETCQKFSQKIIILARDISI